MEAGNLSDCLNSGFEWKLYLPAVILLSSFFIIRFSCFAMCLHARMSYVSCGYTSELYMIRNMLNDSVFFNIFSISTIFYQFICHICYLLIPM